MFDEDYDYSMHADDVLRDYPHATALGEHRKSAWTTGIVIALVIEVALAGAWALAKYAGRLAQ